MLVWWKVCTANTGDKGFAGCVCFLSGLDGHAPESCVLYATIPAKAASVRGVGYGGWRSPCSWHVHRLLTTCCKKVKVRRSGGGRVGTTASGSVLQTVKGLFVSWRSMHFKIWSFKLLCDVSICSTSVVLVFDLRVLSNYLCQWIRRKTLEL